MVVLGELWAWIEPLLPVVPRRAVNPGRRRLDDRKVLCGIPWEFLPQELGFGSGMTCWRLRDWHEAGVWQQLHEALLAELNAARALDWPGAVIAARTGPSQPEGSRWEVVWLAAGPASVGLGEIGASGH